MPIKKLGKKWIVDNVEFDSETAAENAYKAKIALAFGVPPEEDKKDKKPKKKVAKKTKKADDAEEEDADEDEE